MTVAAVQMDVRLGDVAGNAERALAWLERAACLGAELIVLPEAALSGYCFASRDEAAPHALAQDAEPLPRFAARCAELGVTGVLGFLEAAPGGRVYNSACIAMPSGEVATYRKTHLPTLGVDRFLSKGDRLPVFDAPWGSLGCLICYDVRFPEPARVLALKGADVLAVPTNWPEGAESTPDFVLRARARENRVFVVAADRVGVERGRRFIGRSQIVDATGRVLAEAGGEEETILTAQIDPAEARRKRIVIEPGEWEQDSVGDRRPELYGLLEATDHA
ncbi:MAG: carbon-nitrogen hydrolase family protein [Armatimonadetes bacterium]|nr:carbon-nitrogen hydrolase family protein [Armatimonadota bacterium]